MRVTTGAEEFRNRASHEARRYGADQWVFVRELLQNSRDAGARNVWITTSTGNGSEILSVRDDGTGMSFEDARQFLLTLYASNKGGDRGSAGCFGVGFWSVLRFDPARLTIRSRPSRGEAWQLRLDGSLAEAELDEADVAPGTEVILERSARGVDVEGAVRRAAFEDARFLSTRSDLHRPVRVQINSRPVNAVFDLPPPSMSFERRGLRGVVALGPEPRVDLFAHGLRVRTASSLDDLLVHRRDQRRRSTSLPEGVAPRVLLDSSALEVLMSRGDAREDRVLERSVRIARRELQRLVRRELDRSAPGSPLQRVAEGLAAAWSLRSVRLGVLVLTACIALGLTARLLLPDFDTDLPSPLRAVLGRLAPEASSPPESAASGSTGTQSRAYHDLESAYQGPVLDPLGSRPSAVDLLYLPTTARPYFVALRVDGLSADGRIVLGEPPAVEILSAPCKKACLEVEVMVDASAGLLRLPVPTGYLVDAATVQLDGEPLQVIAATGGAPAVRLAHSTGGRLRYGCGEAPSMSIARGGSWPALPADLEDFARTLNRLPVDLRIERAVAEVHERLEYDRAPAVAARLQAARGAGRDLFTAALEVGAGDCDLLSVLVAAILDRSGVPTRVAIGLVGAHGRVLPGLHAWVEAAGDDDRWRVVEATAASPVEIARISMNPGIRPPEPLQRPSSREHLLVAVLSISGALLVVSGLLLARGRTRRRYSAGVGAELEGLVRGALAGPRSLAAIRSLFVRPIVPMLNSPPISLRRAQDLARNGRLYGSPNGDELAQLAAARGCRVVDLGQPVGSAVGELLGACDLDAWGMVLAHSRESKISRRIDKALEACGVGWKIRVGPGDEEVAAPDLGFARVAVVSRSSRVCQAAHHDGRTRPARAALLLGDAVLPRLQLAARSKARVLALLARQALAEATAGSG